MPEDKGRSSEVRFQGSTVKVGGGVYPQDLENTPEGAKDESAIKYDPDGTRMDSSVPLGDFFTDSFGNKWEFRRKYINDKGEVRFRYSLYESKEEAQKTQSTDESSTGAKKRTGGVDIHADENSTTVTTAFGTTHLPPGQRIDGSVVGRKYSIGFNPGGIIPGDLNIDSSSFIGGTAEEDAIRDFSYALFDSTQFQPSDVKITRSVEGNSFEEDGKKYIFAGEEKRLGWLYVTREYAQKYQEENQGKPINAIYSKTLVGGGIKTRRGLHFYPLFDGNEPAKDAAGRFMYALRT